MNLLVFGLGYSAIASVNLMGDQILKNAGAISATTRNEEKKKAISACGLRAHLFDGSPPDEALRREVRTASHILTSISPPRNLDGGDPVLEQFSDDIRANQNLQWIGYYSTVGVYGDHQGQWIDEKATLNPVSARSIARVNAEAAWQALAEEKALSLSIIRLAGIYGPGRNAFLSFKEGRARRIIKPGQVFNRIHVADIAQITKAALEKTYNGILNGSDDEPAPPQDVVEYAATLMGQAVPPGIPFEDADLSPMGRSFYGETKRVSNAFTKKQLGLELIFPTYRTAFDAMWATQNWAKAAPLKDFSA